MFIETRKLFHWRRAFHKGREFAYCRRLIASASTPYGSCSRPQRRISQMTTVITTLTMSMVVIGK